MPKPDLIKVIVVTHVPGRNCSFYRASLEYPPGEFYGFGESIPAAIGNLVFGNPERFGVEIKKEC